MAPTSMFFALKGMGGLGSSLMRKIFANKVYIRAVDGYP